MNQTSIVDRYFKWVCRLVYNDQYTKNVSYRKLLRYLDEVDFNYTIEMDGNRAEDGINLRYRFGYENDIPEPVIASCLDVRPCSVLEMMVALALRCEETIMDNAEVGNRTSQWFWNMIVNLGLGSMSDQRFNEQIVEDIVHIFLNREYGRKGEGGLFTVQNPPGDMRNVEIWYQMCWYLNEIIDDTY